MEYLYNDGDDYYFMDQESYEQTHLKRDALGDAVEFLTPNLLISVPASTTVRPSASSSPRSSR